LVVAVEELENHHRKQLVLMVVLVVAVVDITEVLLKLVELAHLDKGLQVVHLA
jgi:hypothetical protein